jgi:hypothetical protein
VHWHLFFGFVYILFILLFSCAHVHRKALAALSALQSQKKELLDLE